MTGRSERPSRPPREKRIATKSEVRSYHAERSAIALLYAAKIAAARLYASKDHVEAIIAALRAEERAALEALRMREQSMRQARRRTRLAFTFAARAALGGKRRRRGCWPRTRIAARGYGLPARPRPMPRKAFPSNSMD
jgi:hypothetical protein